MNGAGTSIAGSRIPKSAFFRNRQVSKPTTADSPDNASPPSSAGPSRASPKPKSKPTTYDLDRDLPPPPPTLADTFGRTRHAPAAYEQLEDEPPYLDDRFTPMPARSTRRQRPARGDKLGREALDSPPPTVRVEDELPGFASSGSGGSGASGSGLSLGLSGLESSTSTAATSTAAITVTPLLSRTMGSDEMLFALLAGQAAVDCSELPIGGWEEVEGWKKELQILSSRLQGLQARHQREVKILAAARTLQKLNSSHKRMSKATMESLEQSEKRVVDAEKELLVLRDREAALRRRLMEHWAGVMAWEVRRLERQAADAGLQHESQMQAAMSRERDAGPSRSPPDSGAAKREQELLDRLGRVEAERDQHAERLRAAESDLDDHAARARTLDDKLRDIEAERDGHAETARAAKAELDKHVNRARVLESERDKFSSQSREWASQRDEHTSRIRDLEGDRDQRGERIAELESMVQELGELEDQMKELGGRERQLEENTLAAQSALKMVNEEREEWAKERTQLITEREELIVERDGLLSERDSLNRERDDIYHKHGALVAESASASKARDKLTAERDAWVAERQVFVAERVGHATERTRLTEVADKASTRSRALDRVCADMTQLLGHDVNDYELPAAVDEIRARQEKKEREIASLKEELKEVTHGLEAEIGRIKTERDTLRTKADEAGPSARAMQVEMTELVRKIRSQNDTIAELQQQSNSGRGTTDELSTINVALAKAWRVLPAPGARADAGLSARVLSPGVSPNSPVDFAALQKAYINPPADEYTGVNDLVTRIKGVVEDGRIMADRMGRMEVEKERHKANAARAAKLVEDSRHSLETYQRQVDILKGRLAHANGHDLQDEVSSLRSQLDEAHAEISRLCSELSSAHDSRPNGKPSAAMQNELSSLQRDLDQALSQNRKLGDEIASRSEAITRLNEVNDQLSARTLAMAEDAEGDKRALSSRHAEELDNERAKFLEQRIQMMDEMNSLQAEVGELRAKLRR